MSPSRLRAANARIEAGAPPLWDLAQEVIATAEAAGIVTDRPDPAPPP